MKKKAPAHVIRAATVDDVDAMFSVRGAVGENTLTAEELATIGITPESIAQMVRSAPCAWVATVEQTVVGFAMADLDSACLFALFVRPQYEGQGMGTGLTQVCEQALFAHHALIWLETARDSRAAQLYRALGWGQETDIGGGDIRMEKRRP